MNTVRMREQEQGRYRGILTGNVIKVSGGHALLYPIKQLVEHKTTPRNRDEQEIAGYRDFGDEEKI